ncbi:hypothetical protein K439DRAFT_1102556 [Ramaria rubella]|nr:hypothetical protein K439DRAFT_1102556 [Ramaria rubella]
MYRRNQELAGNYHDQELKPRQTSRPQPSSPSHFRHIQHITTSPVPTASNATLLHMAHRLPNGDWEFHNCSPAPTNLKARHEHYSSYSGLDPISHAPHSYDYDDVSDPILYPSKCHEEKGADANMSTDTHSDEKLERKHLSEHTTNSDHLIRRSALEVHSYSESKHEVDSRTEQVTVTSTDGYEDPSPIQHSQSVFKHSSPNLYPDSVRRYPPRPLPVPSALLTKSEVPLGPSDPDSESTTHLHTNFSLPNPQLPPASYNPSRPPFDVPQPSSFPHPLPSFETPPSSFIYSGRYGPESDTSSSRTGPPPYIGNNSPQTPQTPNTPISSPQLSGKNRPRKSWVSGSGWKRS